MWLTLGFLVNFTLILWMGILTNLTKTRSIWIILYLKWVKWVHFNNIAKNWTKVIEYVSTCLQLPKLLYKRLLFSSRVFLFIFDKLVIKFFFKKRTRVLTAKAHLFHSALKLPNFDPYPTRLTHPFYQIYLRLMLFFQWAVRINYINKDINLSWIHYPERLYTLVQQLDLKYVFLQNLIFSWGPPPFSPYNTLHLKRFWSNICRHK